MSALNFWLDSNGKAIEAVSQSVDPWQVPLCSGMSQYHTDNPDNERARPLDWITLQQIREMIESGRDGLKTYKKDLGPWFVPSDIQSRRHAEHHSRGQFWALWFDADDMQFQALEDSTEAACRIIPGTVMAYTSRSATRENPKHRLIIPLSEPLSGARWLIYQRLLNEKMQSAGIAPDDVNERCGQPCFLPNPGELFETYIRDGGLMDPQEWAQEADQIEQAELEAEQQRQAKLQAARQHRLSNPPPEGGIMPSEWIREHYSARTLLESLGATFVTNKRFYGIGRTIDGKPGGYYDPDTNRFYSHHAGDEFADGYWHGSVDLLMKQHDIDWQSPDALVELCRVVKLDNGKTIEEHNRQVFMQAKEREQAKRDLQKMGIQPEQAAAIVEDSSQSSDAAPQWLDAVDVFTEYVAPPFPMHTLPEQIREWAGELSKQSGFEAGAYAFAALVTCCNHIDHRARLKISSHFKQPAFIWAGLNDPSGGGKSAIIGAATKPVHEIEDRRMKGNSEALSRWKRAIEKAKDEGEGIPPKPLWRQRIAQDVTTEALGDVLESNPEGVNFFFDELTEFIGRMDAYSGGNGGKDRGTYIRAYDGKSATVNRRNRQEPQYIPHFSVGMFAGVQPEKLAVLFRQKGAQSDGLYQRFLMYSYPAAGDASFFAEVSPFTVANFSALVDRIEQWNGDGSLTRRDAELCKEGRAMLEEYNNKMRKLAQRIPAPRLREHLNRMPGIAFRLLFGLHVVEQAAAGTTYDSQVKPETVKRALQIMAVMYRHSEGVYEMLDNTQGDVLRLTRSAAEAILSKGWQTFKRGDLTRHATGWRDTDARHSEGAIDYLIELGWLKDITPEPVRGKRGRKSDGVFMVNPYVHEHYQDHAHRVTKERAERYAAIQELAAERRSS